MGAKNARPCGLRHGSCAAGPLCGPCRGNVLPWAGADPVTTFRQRRLSLPRRTHALAPSWRTRHRSIGLTYQAQPARTIKLPGSAGIPVRPADLAGILKSVIPTRHPMRLPTGRNARSSCHSASRIRETKKRPERRLFAGHSGGEGVRHHDITKLKMRHPNTHLTR